VGAHAWCNDASCVCACHRRADDEPDESIDDFLTAVIDDFRRTNVWDEAPTLAVLCQDREGALRGVLAFPDSVWSFASPFAVLRTLAGAVRQIGIMQFPEELTPLGLVLVSEGYGIDGDARPAGYWETHRIADDPAGYEYVSAIAVDLAGGAYGRVYRRHAAEAYANTDTTGRLVDALRELLDAMQLSIPEATS